MSTKKLIRGWVYGRVRLDEIESEHLMDYYVAASRSPHRRTREGEPTILTSAVSYPDDEGWVHAWVKRHARADGNARWDFEGDVAQAILGKRDRRGEVRERIDHVEFRREPVPPTSSHGGP